MALMITTGDIPKNAIQLTKSEAVNYQWMQIRDWPNQGDVWPFKYGIGSLAVIAASTGAYINRHYRRKLKLKHQGLMSSTFPLTFGPAMFSALFHTRVVTYDLMLNETKCPLCVQHRAAGIQLACAIVYPLIMSPIANFLCALRHGTYKLPYYTEVGETLRLWVKLTKPAVKPLIAIGLVQSLITEYITYEEAKSLYKMRAELIRMQEEDKRAKEVPS